MMSVHKIFTRLVYSNHVHWSSKQYNLWCRAAKLCTDVKENEKTEGEKKILDVLKARFETATAINVQDISGGCGAMYEVNVEDQQFKGKRTVAQHRLVTDALAEEIKDMHGLRINTRVPDK